MIYYNRKINLYKVLKPPTAIHMLTQEYQPQMVIAVSTNNKKASFYVDAHFNGFSVARFIQIF